MSTPLSPHAEQKFWAGADAASRFFMGPSDVGSAMRKLAKLLEESNLPYAIIGAMALNEFGYQRMTADVDVLMKAKSLEAFKAQHLGRGYVEKFPGGRGLRDTENGVDIRVVLSGGFPGDGKPKAIAFPDPKIAEQGRSVRLLPLATLIELKLASGMTAPHRLKDLADVQELIRAAALPRPLGEKLHESVRAKYFELWDAVSQAPPE
jgi:hypothetical protein